jgi:hypothetical protein
MREEPHSIELINNCRVSFKLHSDRHVQEEPVKLSTTAKHQAQRFPKADKKDEDLSSKKVLESPDPDRVKVSPKLTLIASVTLKSWN